MSCECRFDVKLVQSNEGSSDGGGNEGERGNVLVISQIFSVSLSFNIRSSLS